MRVVMVVPRFPKLSETFLVNKFVGLVDAGLDVHIVCQQTLLEDWDLFPLLQNRPELRQRIHSQWQHDPRWVVPLLWLPALLTTFGHAPRATWRYWKDAWHRFGVQGFKQFYLDAAIIALAPDILHFEFGALAVDRLHLKKSLGSRLVASFRGYDLEHVGLENPDQYVELWKQVDAVHLLSNSLWQRALSRGCPPETPHALIPPAIDTSYFISDGAAREPLAITTERPLRILSVGRLEWVKGYEYAFEAVRLLREQNVPCEYRILGSGNYLEPLGFARHQMGLEDEIKFLGGQPHSVVIEEMNAADVFLQASVSEGFCNAVLEAQAMRLPIVASDAGGLKENVVSGETGLVVPRRNAQAMADKLAQLASDAELRQKMGEAGRRRVQRCFQLADQIVAFEKFYQVVVGNDAN